MYTWINNLAPATQVLGNSLLASSNAGEVGVYKAKCRDVFSFSTRLEKAYMNSVDEVTINAGAVVTQLLLGQFEVTYGGSPNISSQGIFTPTEPGGYYLNYFIKANWDPTPPTTGSLSLNIKYRDSAGLYSFASRGGVIDTALGSNQISFTCAFPWYCDNPSLAEMTIQLWNRTDVTLYLRGSSNGSIVNVFSFSEVGTNP